MGVHQCERARKGDTLPPLQWHDARGTSQKTFPGHDSEDSGIGIAIENNCAIEFIDGRFYRVVTSEAYARAYKVYENGSEVVARQIRQQQQFMPIEALVD